MRSEVDGEDPVDAELAGDPHGHLTDGTEADDNEQLAGLDAGVLHGLPRRGQHVGQEQEPVIVRTLGNLDRPVVGMRHAQVLGLGPSDLAVELRVAEEGRTRVVFADLGGLALRLQAFGAEEARTAGDAEGHDHAVADLQRRTLIPTSSTIPIGS
jgi:hypothetical protein